MNINDFLKQWQQSVDKAHSQQDDSIEIKDLYSVARMHTRSDTTPVMYLQVMIRIGMH